MTFFFSLYKIQLNCTANLIILKNLSNWFFYSVLCWDISYIAYIFEYIDKICTVCWRCWFTLVVGGFSQETCNLVNSGCWMFAPHLLPSIPLSSSAAGNLTAQQASPGKWRHITWNFWSASLILTDSINVMLVFYISLHKTRLELLTVLCSERIWLM